MRRFLKSFVFAFNGLAYAFKTQLNFKIHCVAAVVVALFGIYVELATTEWLWIALAVFLVIASELINTAIEVLVDLISPEHQPKAGAIKDLAAATVLVIALLAICIALFIFVPKFS